MLATAAGETRHRGRPAVPSLPRNWQLFAVQEQHCNTADKTDDKWCFLYDVFTFLKKTLMNELFEVNLIPL